MALVDNTFDVLWWDWSGERKRQSRVKYKHLLEIDVFGLKNSQQIFHIFSFLLHEIKLIKNNVLAQIRNQLRARVFLFKQILNLMLEV